MAIIHQGQERNDSDRVPYLYSPGETDKETLENLSQDVRVWALKSRAYPKSAMVAIGPWGLGFNSMNT